MARIPIGLELYSVRNELAADAAGTIRAVAEMGYEGVEFAGPPQHSGAELRKMLDDNGLVCCGWHTPFDRVQDDTLAATIELNQTVGNRFIIIPGMLYAKTLNSPYAYAKIISIDCSEAEKLPGVRAVQPATEGDLLRKSP